MENPGGESCLGGSVMAITEVTSIVGTVGIGKEGHSKLFSSTWKTKDSFEIEILGWG